jgi:hypothetical protein
LLGDVLEVAKRAPAALSEAWLTETQQRFAVNGKELLRLADGGMPSRVIDLMIAMSNPETFAVRTPSGEGRRAANTDVITGGFDNMRSVGACGRMLDFCYGPGGMGAWGLGWQYGMSPFDDYSLRYGMGGFFNPFGFGNGFYPGNRPIIIVNRGDVDLPAARATSGRAIRGGGYTRASSSGGSSPPPIGGFGSSGSGSSSGSGGSSSGGGGGGGESSGGGGGRTAKPRGSGGV